jgi:hypothetical protein
MNVRAIQNLVKKQPFEPFEIVLSSGDRYTVKHPENCMMLKEGVIVSYSNSAKDSLPDDFAILSCLHIAAAEPARQRGRTK